MAIEGNLQIIPGLVAGEDLSAYQYHFVKLSADFTVVHCDGATDCPIGILQDAPKDKQAASVAYAGISKLKMGATATIGQRIGTDNASLGVPYAEGTGTTNYLCGRILEAATATNDIRSVLLAGTPHRGA